MVLFLDSSALAKRYVRERGSAWVNARTDPLAGNDIYVASIAHVEVVSAIRRRQLAGTISPESAAAILKEVHDDFTRQYVVAGLTPALVARAVFLAEIHALRSGDALHLAAALEVRANAFLLGVSLTLVSADGELNAAAESERLHSENPEVHP